MEFLNFVKGTVFYKDGEGSRAQLIAHWALNILALLVWCVGLGLLSLYWGQRSYGGGLFESYLGSAALLALNIAPALLLALLLFLITNRVWPAVLGSGVLVMALTHINYFKLLIRDDPLLAGDVRFFFEAARIVSKYNVSLTRGIVLCYVVVLLGGAFAFFFLKARFRRPVPRIACAAVCAAACLGLYFGAYASGEVYDATENLGAVTENGRALDAHNAADQYVSRGFLYPLLHSLTELSRVPEGYSKDSAAAALAEYGGAPDEEGDAPGEAPAPKDADIPEERKVNVISVMLEAYCDFSVYDEIFDFQVDPYGFYHELQGESYHGTLVTNIFAGGTIDTERCFIAGTTEGYDYRASAWSYARYFNDQGYLTEFCHPGYAWYYNRQNVMDYMGFQRQNYFEDRYRQPEGYELMWDNQFLPDLAELLEAAAEEEGKPYFNFSVTYQNHGPYAEDYLYDTETEYVARGGLSEKAYNILNNYFWGIRQTDAALRDFVGRLQSSGEPVVLVLFGDHKPWLGDGSFVYDELGFDLTIGTEQSFYDYCGTEYLIWANDAAKAALGAEFTGEGEPISPLFLMLKVFDLCSWEGPAYTQALRELYSAGVTVVNYFGLFVENGVLGDHLSEGPKDLLFRIEHMEYYLMHDWAFH